MPLSVGTVERVKAVAAESGLSAHGWPRYVCAWDAEKVADAHEGAPVGYTTGMALAYAKAYARLKQGGDHYVELMARPLVPVEGKYADRDALYFLRGRFAERGMANETARERLRHLFVLMYELGVRESDGRYYLGIDDGRYKPSLDADDDVADATEAGLFQSSWDFTVDEKEETSEALLALTAAYRDGSREGIPVADFKKGVEPPEKGNDASGGAGKGRTFQKLAKSQPEYAVEFAALTLRRVGGGDYFFVENKLLQISPEADAFFRKVERIVDGE